MLKVRKAIIPAAGLGTRFLPASKAVPKEMLPIVDKPTLQYIVEEVVAAGIEEILIITGRNKGAIEDHFDYALELDQNLLQKGKKDLLRESQSIAELANIHYLRQKKPLGLGHAISCAEAFVGKEPFSVLLGDDIVWSQKPCIKQLLEIFAQKQKTILGVQRVDKKEVTKYGIVNSFNQEQNPMRVKSLVEKPDVAEAPSDVAILGRYIIMPEIFEILKGTSKGAGGEVQLTDALNVLAAEQQMFAYIFDGIRYDAGDKLGYLKATCEFALARPDLGQAFKAYLQELLKD